MFHSDRGTQYTAFAFRQLLNSLNVVQSFSKKAIRLTMYAANVFSIISKKKKQIAKVTIPFRRCSFLSLSISKDIIIRKDLTVRLVCSPQTKQNLYNRSRTLNLLLKNLYFFVSTYLTKVHTTSQIVSYISRIISCSLAFLSASS